jgi:hypothetical protein
MYDRWAVSQPSVLSCLVRDLPGVTLGVRQQPSVTQTVRGATRPYVPLCGPQLSAASFPGAVSLLWHVGRCALCARLLLLSLGWWL